MLKYDDHFNPPAPVVDVEVLNRFTRESTQLRGQIDTGSSISVIPLEVAESMRLTSSDFTHVRGVDRVAKRVPLFVITMRLQSFVLINVEVTGIEREDMLIGRDILEHFILTLDGTQRMFTMTAP